MYSRGSSADSFGPGDAAMMFPCCNAIDQVKLSKTKTQNPVQTTNINDRDGYRYLRSCKTEEEADDATDNEERAWGLDSLKSLLHT
ncbi:uncharacterized protein KRP23_10080 [Phytophthora ramorum]|uniref:uncharacterized protein n=1 Tax=Phytophthora ramorum TaxID=164328 RepID=UPI00309E51D7|nr:hypothetical protein KRP23_10080 [Phytophthora ramorum]